MTGHNDDSARYLVISSDTHAGPPAERYRDYLDPKYHAAFDADLAMALEMNKARSAQSDAAAFEAKWEAETGDGGRRASWDPAVRDDELDKEGVAAGSHDARRPPSPVSASHFASKAAVSLCAARALFISSTMARSWSNAARYLRSR